MSIINAVGGTNNSTHRVSRELSADKLDGHRPAPWKRNCAVSIKKQPHAVAPDKLPPWMAAAGQQAVGAVQYYLPVPYNLGVYIGKDIRSYIENNNNIRADIAELLQHPAVLAAAATVAPHIIGAFAMNQLAFNGPLQVGRQPPV